MDDHELVQRFIKIEPEADCINLFVCKIAWDGPYTPTSTWELVTKLKVDAPSEEIDAKVYEALNDEQHFRICMECGERNPCGWMHNKSICQSCAEKNHGVVH